MFWYTCRYTDPFPWWQCNFLFVFFCLFIYFFFAFTKTSLILITCFHIDRGKIFPTFLKKKKKPFCQHWLSFVFLNLFTFLEKVKNKTAPFIPFACNLTQIFSLCSHQVASFLLFQSLSFISSTFFIWLSTNKLQAAILFWICCDVQSIHRVNPGL